MDNLHIVNYEALREYCKKIIMTQGVPDEEAFIIADSLVDADLCGVESHGVSRMSIYMKRFEEGVVARKCELKIEQEYAGGAAINACNSAGMVVGVQAMQKCIDKAKESGCCFITVNNSNHYGMASYFVKMAAQQNMVGITATNAPPNIAPWGSYKSYVGTNPIAFSIPTKGEPIILDMAPSIVAMGKIILAAKLGKDIPEGWAITKEGKPTTNAVEASKGTVLPIGGPKGYGLSMIMDILCGILSGAQFGPHLNNMWNDFVNPQNVGHIFCAIDVSKYTNVEVFKERVGQMVSEIKALPKNPGVEEIFVPGEIEQRRRDGRKENGIELSDVVYQELKGLGEKYNVSFSI